MSFAVSSCRARGAFLLVVMNSMLALAASVSASSLRHHNRVPTRAFVSAAAALLNKPHHSGWMASKRGGSAGGGGIFGRKGSVKMMGTSCLMTSTPNSNFKYPPAAASVLEKTTSYLATLADEDEEGSAVPLELVARDKFDAWLATQPEQTKAMLAFKAEDGLTVKHREGSLEVIPAWGPGGKEGGRGVEKVVLFVRKGGLTVAEPFVLSSLPNLLPPSNTYVLVDFEGGANTAANPTLAAFSWAMGTYKMDRYKQKPAKKEGGGEGGADDALKRKARLVWPKGADKEEVQAKVGSTFLVRDMVNMPAECMGPPQLQQTAEMVAALFGAKAKVIIGDDLLKENYPMIHSVGRAADIGREPRLIDLTWGEVDRPKITLVGKGVCYDTGGLDIKPGNSMAGMKKDMAGAAQILGLAYMIMASKLPIRLRVLIPAVENSVDARAYRNGDIIQARNGKTSEIMTTDAEGRLVLADALVEADSEDPDLIIDAATLTGAARVAVGTEMSAIWSNKEALGRRLQDISWEINDPCWMMPLYAGYRKHLKSNLADLRNTGNGGSGSITAALYLQEFLQKRSSPGTSLQKHKATPWIHMDFMGSNNGGRPGRPEGGDAQGMRALFEVVKEVGAKGGWPKDGKEEEEGEEGKDE